MPFGLPVEPDENSTMPGVPRWRNSLSSALSLFKPRCVMVASRPAASNSTYHSQPETASATDSSTTDVRVNGITMLPLRPRAMIMQNTSGE